MVDFLNEEITAERKLLKSSTIPVEVDGFKVKLNGSEVTLTKTIGDETYVLNEVKNIYFRNICRFIWLLESTVI